MNHPAYPNFDQLIQRAAEALKAAGAREVFVLGSCAQGTAEEDSDIDMAVSGLPPEVFFKALSAAGMILDREIDLVDLDADNPYHPLPERGKRTCPSRINWSSKSMLISNCWIGF